MQRAAEERYPALKTAPRYSRGLYNARLTYDAEKKKYAVYIRQRSDAAGAEELRPENDGSPGGDQCRRPLLLTADADEAVNFLVDNLKSPTLFDLDIVRDKAVVAALKRRGTCSRNFVVVAEVTILWLRSRKVLSKAVLRRSRRMELAVGPWLGFRP